MRTPHQRVEQKITLRTRETLRPFKGISLAARTKIALSSRKANLISNKVTGIFNRKEARSERGLLIEFPSESSCKENNPTRTDDNDWETNILDRGFRN